jgi:hypothetical protein
MGRSKLRRRKAILLSMMRFKEFRGISEIDEICLLKAADSCEAFFSRATTTLAGRRVATKINEMSLRFFFTSLGYQAAHQAAHVSLDDGRIGKCSAR